MATHARPNQTRSIARPKSRRDQRPEAMCHCAVLESLPGVLTPLRGVFESHRDIQDSLRGTHEVLGNTLEILSAAHLTTQRRHLKDHMTPLSAQRLGLKHHVTSLEACYNYPIVSPLSYCCR